jgi:hypothetical protein
MVFFNYSTMQMAAKVVYYGPGLCGKTTNLQWIFENTATDSRGEMVSLATETDRTLFFDLLPIDVGSIAGFSTRIQLYTVPGQVFYNTTRKLVLKGVDGVVFVADSQRPMLQANVESFQNLEENLAEMGLSLDTIPLVLQYNKRDLPNICDVAELDQALNRQGWSSVEAAAIDGRGVFETLKVISKKTLLALKKRLTKGRSDTPAAAAPRAPSPPASGAPPRPAGAAAAPAAATPPPGSSTGARPSIPGAAPSTAAAAATATATAATAAAKDDTVGKAPEVPGAPPPRESGGGFDAPPPVRDPEEALEQASAAVRALQVEPAPSSPKQEEAAAPRQEPAAPQPAAARPAAPQPPAQAQPKKRRTAGFDALAELEKLRLETIRPGKPAAVVNGKGEIRRDFRLALERDSFRRAQRFAVILRLEDEDRRVVEEAEHMHVEIEDAASLERLLLRLNIDLGSAT